MRTVACLFALLAALPAAAQTTQTDASTLSGLRFRSIGPAAMSGRITDVAVLESDPTLMYIASATGGISSATRSGSAEGQDSRESEILD